MVSLLDRIVAESIGADGLVVNKDLYLNIAPNMYNNIDYNGTESKCGVSIDGENYILKRQKKDWNNVVTEYVASNVIKELGGLVHETSIALENNRFVVLCKDFTDVYGRIKSISSISESSIDTDAFRHDYYFEDILYELSKLKDCNLDNVKEGFLKMYVFDTILGNPDRYSGNWALYKDKGVYKFAPIFDNGASLFPRAKFSSVSKDWMYERIFVFPNSKIMFEGKRGRSNYNEIWSSNILPKNIVDWAISLDIDKAIDWINKNPYLTKEAKCFYSMIIKYRFNVLVRREEFKWR